MPDLPLLSAGFHFLCREPTDAQLATFAFTLDDVFNDFYICIDLLLI